MAVLKNLLISDLKKLKGFEPTDYINIDCIEGKNLKKEDYKKIYNNFLKELNNLTTVEFYNLDIDFFNNKVKNNCDNINIYYDIDINKINLVEW